MKTTEKRISHTLGTTNDSRKKLSSTKEKKIIPLVTRTPARGGVLDVRVRGLGVLGATTSAMKASDRSFRWEPGPVNGTTQHNVQTT